MESTDQAPPPSVSLSVLDLPQPPSDPPMDQPRLMLDSIVAPNPHDFFPSPTEAPGLSSNAPPLQQRHESDDGSDSDGDDSIDDEENDNPDIPRWFHLEEDKSAPCEDELKFITSKEEHSALDHAYWEDKAFFSLDDPDLVPLTSGRIEWLVEKYNGTKEDPNNNSLMTSPIVRIGDLDWQIKFYPKGHRCDYLSVYVECVSMLSPEYTQHEDFDTPPFPFLQGAEKVQRRRSVAAQICVVMYNPTEPRVYEHQAEAHQFHKASADYGWKYFTRLPRFEFHQRQHAQRQSILRDDKLAFTAYIRIVRDPTGCMWQHGMSTPGETTSITGLRPFTSSFNYTAIVLPLLHFAPFRRFVRDLKSDGTLAKWLKSLLLKMYTRARSTAYGFHSSLQDGDVMEMLWRMSLNIKSQHDEATMAQFNDLLGTVHAGKGAPSTVRRLSTSDHRSIQSALNQLDGPLGCPLLLTLELQRQEHDKKARKWLKITNKVEVEDHIQVSSVSYTLFAFITHCGGLHSTRYKTYVRPNGIGKGWFAYEDGHVTCLTETQARRIHSGPDDNEVAGTSSENSFRSIVMGLRETGSEVACVVLYARHDAAAETFAASTEEVWATPFNNKDSGATEPPVGTAQETSQALPACESRRPPDAVEVKTDLDISANDIKQAAGASTPAPVLYDGEDIIMGDADDASSFTFEAPKDNASQSDLAVGTLDWLGRPYYQGQYQGAKYHGGGHLISLNGDEYLGSFKDGRQHGYGKMIYSATGNVYEGEWSEGEHHGRGKLLEHATGNVFEGGWQNGRKHGEFVLKGTVTEEDRGCCTICYSKEMSTAFYDCGHVVACNECAAMVDNCPVCRRRVVARLQLYGVKVTLA